jgi:hypothetical protein
LSSIVLISDANISFDHSPPIILRESVWDTYTTVTRGRGGSHTLYHVLLNSPRETKDLLPTDVQVSSGIFSRAHKGGELVVTMHAGALGIPWVQAIRAAP